MKTNEEPKKIKLGIIIILFIILTVVVSGISIKDKFFIGTKSLESIGTAKVGADLESKFKMYDNKIIINEGKEINCYNYEGVKEWSKSIIYDEPLVFFGKEAFYIGDSLSGEITAYNLANEELWKYSLKQSIEQILERNNSLFVFTKAGENIGQMNIISSKGVLLANSIVNNGTVINGNVHLDNKNFILASLDIESGVVNSNLMVYSIDGVLKWVRVFENQITNTIEYVNKDDILVVTDMKILLLNDENEVLWNKDLEGSLKDIYVDKDNNKIITLYEEGSTIFEIISMNGRTDNRTELNGNYDNLKVFGNKVYLTGGNKVTGFDNNEEFINYALDEEIIDINVKGNNVIVLLPSETKIMKLVNEEKK